MKPLWIHRPLINWRPVFAWAEQAGVKKMMPPEQLHCTLATVREPVEWGDIALHDHELMIPAGHKSVQIFGFTSKALAFGSAEVKARHEELAEMFPMMDHAQMLRPHVTLFRGGKMPKIPYEGELVFGPEQAEEFNAQLARDIKHVLVAKYA